MCHQKTAAAGEYSSFSHFIYRKLRTAAESVLVCVLQPKLDRGHLPDLKPGRKINSRKIIQKLISLLILVKTAVRLAPIRADGSGPVIGARSDVGGHVTEEGHL